MPLHAATIIGAMTLVATATLLLLRARAKSISNLRKTLARSWTNEGDTRGTPVRRPRSPAGGGGLVGQVTSQAADRPFEANVHVGWARVTLEILELRRRSLARVGRARLRLTDDRNRLDWLSSVTGEKRCCQSERSFGQIRIARHASDSSVTVCISRLTRKHIDSDPAQVNHGRRRCPSRARLKGASSRNSS